MNTTRARCRNVTLGLATLLLLPGGAVCAQSLVTPGPCAIEVAATAAAPPLAPASTDASTPWLQDTFVRFEPYGNCAPKPAEVPTLPEAPAKVEADPPEVKPPAMVQNLRRADLR